MTVRVLSFHAGYRCRHAGACCTSNWPIPIEADRLGQVRAAMASGRLRPRVPVLEPADPANLTPDSVLVRIHGSCVFHSESRCDIQSALGHDALPLACRQFPRVSLHDPRGTSVTLSHYCPTAASMLEAELPAPAAILADAAGFPAAAEYVGLDARTALPPLLRRDMLMDWESWWDCERLAVDLFATARDPEAALDRLRDAVADIETWSPADGPLVERVRHAFSRSQTPRRRDTSGLLTAALDAVPAEMRPGRLPSGPQPAESAARRFLAAHAFANWTMHLGAGLRAWALSIEAAWALIQAGAGVREADLVLRHLADPARFARMLRA